MDKIFDFAKAEAEIYQRWINRDYFRARVNPDKRPYTVIMPPPNITAKLHIGHAFNCTIQDCIVRFKRMQGFEVLYLPGADHAAIATEAKVVDELRKQGIDKNSLSREEFMRHIQKWYDFYTPAIKEQMKKLGLSCDWSRFHFTMDGVTSRAVKQAFKILQDKGFIYKGERMINFCPGCKSVLSDVEVVYSAESRTMYYVEYTFAHRAGGIKVATVRPETIYGDVAVAVNPKDKRYVKFIGSEVINPLTGGKLPVIADGQVDMKFGTGALKITPAHDMADFEIGLRHGLEPIAVQDLSKNARKDAVGKLRANGTLRDEKKYNGNIGKCYRCFEAVEPTVSTQWFVSMKDLAKHAIEVLNNGLTVMPKKFEKIYLHWLYNIKDWCISRQLLSGHKVPVDGETDVLDTWFSSALWPYSCLGFFEDDKSDFEYFYPTQTLVTAYEIIFFWATRMIFSGIFFTKKVPFESLLLHGLVRDSEGRKMSKSLGNGIDPVGIIDRFGTDALRFSLLAGTKLDRDPRYGIDKAVLARNFINKIWNAVKFFIRLEPRQDEELRLADKWILTKLNAVIRFTTKKYEKFDFGIAANGLQRFFWSDFCDIYIEESKKTYNRRVFGYVITAFLKLISPIMPFVTEHIACDELKLCETLSFEKFPAEDKEFNFTKDAKEFENYITELKLERQRVVDAESIRKQIETLQKEIARSENMLGRADFVSKAPKNLVDREREKLSDNRLALAQLSEK
jgi:valyl-tRNA synthetase